MEDARTRPLKYLVAVALNPDAPAKRTSRYIAKLIRAVGAEGAFCVAVNRQRGLALLCSFGLESDAIRLADALQAIPTIQYAGWKRQWNGHLGESIRAGLDRRFERRMSSRS